MRSSSEPWKRKRKSKQVKRGRKNIPGRGQWAKAEWLDILGQARGNGLPPCWAGSSSQDLSAKGSLGQGESSRGRIRFASCKELPGCHGEKGLGC